MVFIKKDSEEDTKLNYSRLQTHEQTAAKVKQDKSDEEDTKFISSRLQTRSQTAAKVKQEEEEVRSSINFETTKVDC